MAVENELVYIVRLTAEGEQEVVKATRVVDETGDAVQQTEKKVGSYKKTLSDTRKSSKNFKKRTSSANNALLDLTRIAQDAPYGIRGIANNLDQAASSGARAYQEFGSFTGVLKGLGGALTGPLGVVAGISAVTLVLQTAGTWFGNTSDKVKQFADNSEKLIDKLKQINNKLADLKNLDSDAFFNTDKAKASLQRFNLVQSDIEDRIDALNKLKENDAFRVRFENTPRSELIKQLQQQNFYPELPEKQAKKAITNYVDFVKNNIDQLDTYQTRHGIGFEFGDKQQKTYDQLKSDLTEVNGQIDKYKNQLSAVDRLSKYPTANYAEQQRSLEELKKKAFELDDSLQFDNTVPDIKTPFYGDNKDTPKLDIGPDPADERQSQRAKQRIEAQKKAAQRIMQNRIQFAQSTNQRIKAINLQEQRAKKNIRDNTLITAQQQQRLLTQTERKYANKRKQIALEEARKKKQYQLRVRNAALSAGQQITNSLQGFGSVIAGNSEENAKKRFEANKAFNYAAAVMNTAAGVTKALSSSPPPLNFIQAGAVSAAGAIQIAKIASTKFNSTGTSGSGSGVSYRGFSSNNTVRNPAADRTRADRPSTNNRHQARQKESRSIKITDGLGNMVAKGQEEIDRKGGTGYVRGD